MAAEPDITLYFALASRGFTARWMLEELGVPYRVEMLDLRKNEQKSPAYLRINPMGKVPALTDGQALVTENPAICLYLADRYGYGTLAPQIEDPARGAYLRWTVFSTAVAEPAIYLDDSDDPRDASGRGWGKRDTVLQVLDEAVSPGPWLLGDRFTAADVMLGSILSVAIFNARFAERPPLTAYNKRLEARPAYRRAQDATWPEAVFGKVEPKR
jgi:glutathione S-transferase